jgi:hypothetical protein
VLLGMAIVVVAFGVAAGSSAGAAASPAACSFVSKQEAAILLGMRARALARYPAPRFTCAYGDAKNRFKGIENTPHSVQLFYGDMRADQSTYIAFRDGRYGHCPQGPKLGDKTCWDRNGFSPRNLTLFARYQTVRMDVHAKVPRRLGEAREVALMRKILRRLPS